MDLMLSHYWPFRGNWSVHQNWDILCGNFLLVHYQFLKILQLEGLIVIHDAVCVGLMKRLLTMYFSNVHQLYKLGHFLGFLLLRRFFHHRQFSPIWILYFGDYQRRRILHTSHSYYGIFGRLEMTRSIQIRMPIHKRYWGWLRWNVGRGQRLS